MSVFFLNFGRGTVRGMKAGCAGVGFPSTMRSVSFGACFFFGPSRVILMRSSSSESAALLPCKESISSSDSGFTGSALFSLDFAPMNCVLDGTALP